MMDKKEIEIKVNEIVDSILEDYAVQKDKEDCDLDLIGMDSMKFISIIVELETFFKIEFSDEYLVIENMNTVHKITDSVYLLLTNASSQK